MTVFSGEKIQIKINKLFYMEKTDNKQRRKG